MHRERDCQISYQIMYRMLLTRRDYVLSSVSSFSSSSSKSSSPCSLLLLFRHTGRQNYRLFAICKIPTLKVLDFQKVKQTERDRAQRLASSAAGAAMEADARLEARAAAADSSAATDGAVASGTYANGSHGDNGTNTFEPGEGKSAEESFATQFTAEEKARIRDMVANAASAEEIDRIESLVKRGVFPGSSESGGNGIVPPPPPPPPPPLPEEGNQDNGDEVGEEGDDSKRQRTE